MSVWAAHPPPTHTNITQIISVGRATVQADLLMDQHFCSPWLVARVVAVVEVAATSLDRVAAAAVAPY
jgi:hypothetical protein